MPLLPAERRSQQAQTCRFVGKQAATLDRASEAPQVSERAEHTGPLMKPKRYVTPAQ
jgi:hypothetical protein